MTDEALFYLKQANLTYRAIADQYGLSEDSVRGRISRYRRELALENDHLRAENERLKAALEAREESDVFGHDLGKPWRLDGDWVIAGDIHANTINRDFMQRPLDIAMRYLEHPRRFMIAGDFINGDAFSGYENVYPLPSFGSELKAARKFLDMYLQVFDEIWIFMGNHDLRVTRKTGTAIMPEDLIRMISHDVRIKVSHWGHAVVDTPRGEYRISHGSEYSVNQLVVAEQLALKHDQNIILWHEHHTAQGLDRFKRRIVVNGGGLFDSDSMAYTQIEDNKKPRMANGFVMLKGGYPYVFNDHWTDWNFWLGKQSIALEAA
jgi:hypothetical protein